MLPARVKVVHLITLLEFGGAQGNTIHTVRHLDPEKYETHLWTGQGAYWDEKIEKSLGLPGRVRFFRSLVRQVNPLLDLISVFVLWRALASLKPEILHTHSSKAGIVGRLAGWLAGVPIIIHTFHGFGFNREQKPWTRWCFITLEKWMAPLAKKLIFVSHANQEEAKHLDIGRTSQYQLIRSGVPLAQIRKTKESVNRNEFRARQGIPVTAKVIITIGAFKPQKNLMDFLEGAKIISETLSDAFFVILGDGQLRHELEKRAESLGIKEKILMPGWSEDAVSFLSVSDVFIMTSLWEGLPRSLVEAMAVGLPVVCYDTDGIRDILHSGEGTLVRQGDVQGLAKQTIRLLTDSNERDRISSVVKQRINIDFDIDHMVKQQDDLYSTLLVVNR